MKRLKKEIEKKEVGKKRLRNEFENRLKEKKNLPAVFSFGFQSFAEENETQV